MFRTTVCRDRVTLCFWVESLEIQKLLNGREECYDTPSKEVSPHQLSLYDWKSVPRGSVRWCPAILWLIFDFPMAFAKFSNTPTYRWSGCLKIGTVNKLMPKVPDPCFNQTELEKFVHKKRSKKEKKYGESLFVCLRKIISANVCNMTVYLV